MSGHGPITPPARGLLGLPLVAADILTLHIENDGGVGGPAPACVLQRAVELPLGPLRGDGEGAGAPREGLSAHAQQSGGAGLLQLSVQVPGQLGGAGRPCHAAGEGVVFLLPQSPLSPDPAVDSRHQLPPAWGTMGGCEGGGLVQFTDQDEVQAQRGGQQAE